jgi:ABC-type multidrug transport system fused ATPase/permease subunit
LELALDNETEREFQRALAQYVRGRTLVVIAHRLSTVEGADQVVVLEHGRVVEVGPPQALLSAEGAFARMHGLQSVPSGAPLAA